MWEQLEITGTIPIFKIHMELPGKETVAVLSNRGDQHIGLESANIELMKADYKTTQDKYRGRLFVIDTGDYIENALKTSIGHNYDIAIADPDEQKRIAIDMQEELDEHLYGKQQYYSMKFITLKNQKQARYARRIGFLGNHEYRTRRIGGCWLNRELYGGRGVIDGWIQAFIDIKITNPRLKKVSAKTYRIWAAHRLTNSAGTSVATLIKNFDKRKSLVNADIYVCGHYHRGFVVPSEKFSNDGKIKKVMYATNPSPAFPTEYAEWAMYTPIMSAYSNEIFLPIDKYDNAYSIV